MKLSTQVLATVASLAFSTKGYFVRGQHFVESGGAAQRRRLQSDGAPENRRLHGVGGGHGYGGYNHEPLDCGSNDLCVCSNPATEFPIVEAFDPDGYDYFGDSEAVQANIDFGTVYAAGYESFLFDFTASTFSLLRSNKNTPGANANANSSVANVEGTNGGRNVTRNPNKRKNRGNNDRNLLFTDSIVKVSAEARIRMVPKYGPTLLPEPAAMLPLNVENKVYDDGYDYYTGETKRSETTTTTRFYFGNVPKGTYRVEISVELKAETQVFGLFNDGSEASIELGPHLVVMERVIGIYTECDTEIEELNED